MRRTLPRARCSPHRPQRGFAGRNGKLVYGWTTLDEPELGPFRYSDGIRVIKAGGGAAYVLARCVRVPEQLPAGDCAPSEYKRPSCLARRYAGRLRRRRAAGTARRRRRRAAAAAGERNRRRRAGLLPQWHPPGLLDDRRRRPGAVDLRPLRPRRQTAAGRPGRIAELVLARHDRLRPPRAAWSVRSDGSGLRQLTRKQALQPAFSPHGTRSPSCAEGP